jgi:hypothetical protein
MGYFMSSFELKVKYKGMFINVLNFTFLLQLLKTTASVIILASFSRLYIYKTTLISQMTYCSMYFLRIK